MIVEKFETDLPEIAKNAFLLANASAVSLPIPEDAPVISTSFSL